MAVITPDALWALLLTCTPMVNGQPLVAPSTLARVIQIGEWHGQPMRSDAISPPDHDGSRDFGLAQINSGNFSWLGLNTQTAMDPCRSIEAEARVFASTAAYNAGNSTSKIGIQYAARTFNAAFTEEKSPVATPPKPACPVIDPNDDGWHTTPTPVGCPDPSKDISDEK